MPYALETPLLQVKGIGEKIATALAEKGFVLVHDLILNLPLHYLDRSTLGEIKDLNPEAELTFVATVLKKNNFYRRPRSIQSATVSDDSGKVKLMWFNNAFILKKLTEGERYIFSGKLGKNNTIVQPVVADVGGDSLHTGRIVPIYSGSLGIQVGKLRRIYKEILDNLEIPGIWDLGQTVSEFSGIKQILYNLHFPSAETEVVVAKERLAIEELLLLMRKSAQIKAQWLALKAEDCPKPIVVPTSELIPTSVPYVLTGAQERALGEIMADLGVSRPMNRLLIGDVGSGKTVVAGIAALHLIARGGRVALIAPTKILAEQHFHTLRELFPQLEIKLLQKVSEDLGGYKGLVVGTHRLLNKLSEFGPSLVIFDEQHRFGVAQRTITAELTLKPHILTMTATPIPRSLMLTIFSHLNLSVIDELPQGRKKTETFLVTEEKTAGFYGWLREILRNQPQAQVLIVCPFIEPSSTEGFTEIKNVETQTKEIEKEFGADFVVGQLHSRLSKEKIASVTADLFAGKIRILVTTPIVEVGIDLPGATVVAIHNAERFGLASLHQIRGRVGRRGDQGYCVLFSDKKTAGVKKRLKFFTSESSGMKLAEFDLGNRGAGDIFGLAQSGDDALRFANWTNLALISQARQIYNKVEGHNWHSVLELITDQAKAVPGDN